MEISMNKSSDEFQDRQNLTHDSKKSDKKQFSLVIKSDRSNRDIKEDLVVDKQYLVASINNLEEEIGNAPTSANNDDPTSFW